MNDFPKGCICPARETSDGWGYVLRLDREHDETCPVHGGTPHNIVRHPLGDPSDARCECGWWGRAAVHPAHQATMTRNRQDNP